MKIKPQFDIDKSHKTILHCLHQNNIEIRRGCLRQNKINIYNNISLFVTRMLM